jgi:DNA-binding PadR family transcriptional regulator
MVDDPSVPWHGYELMKQTKLASGTLYPMLARLEVQGLVSSAWEAAPPCRDGRCVSTTSSPRQVSG